MEAYKNGCYNILPDFICGPKKNRLLDPYKPEAIVRGPSRVLYFPESEIHIRRSYAIGLDVWNYDLYWKNQILGTLLVSSIVFVLNFRKARHQFKIDNMIGGVQKSLSNRIQDRIKALKESKVGSNDNSTNRDQ